VLLIAIGGKLAYGELTGDKVPTALTLGVIVTVISIAVGASLLRERRATATAP
jgi:Kef-type K+ transport system membrane component KefB